MADRKMQWIEEAFTERTHDPSTRQFRTARSHYHQCFRQGLARTVPGFVLRPQQILARAFETPTDYPAAIELANEQHLPMLGSLAARFHAVESEHLGVPGNPVGETLCLACNPSEYARRLSNDAVRDSCQEAKRVVLRYRATERRSKPKRRSGRRRKYFGNRPLDFMQKNGHNRRLWWNPSRDLICIRPEMNPRGSSAIAVDFHNKGNLSQMMLQNPNELAVAVEYNPEWYHDRKSKEHMEKRIHDLNQFLLKTSFPDNVNSRFMYIIDPRAKLRVGPNGKRPELGDPKYRGAGLDFYLADEDDSPFDIHPSLGPLLASLRWRFQSSREIHYRILVPVTSQV